MPRTKPSPRDDGAEALLNWYEPRRDSFPWRRADDPFATWVSEVMLQQTQAARVVPAYEAFLTRFPTVDALARASRRDLLRTWNGLGYPRRAIRLHEAAIEIVRSNGGEIPRDPAALGDLPGIGPYTAAAVASIAFGQPVAAVDTNVRRIVARVHLGVDAHGVPASEVRELAQRWLDRSDPGAWNQALMDLGREVCRPRPRCEVCPLARVCRFRALGVVPSSGPRRQPRFEGSQRQLRGRIVAALLEREPRTLGEIAETTGFALERVSAAARALAADGIVRMGPVAEAGRPRGRVRLAG